jgi:FkbM family methyltransferase
MSWLLTPRLAEVIYTVLLRPRPVRKLANWLLLRVIPSKICLAGTDLYLNPNDPVLSSALAFGVYEPWEQELFRDLCLPGFTVVDLGANVGLYTAIAARAVGKTGQVISVEPHAESFSYLQKTIVSNNLSQVRAFNVACGNRSDKVALYLCEENKADSRLYDTTGTRAKTEVDMVTLDDLLDRLNVSTVNVIKMDIQGSEALALQGMRRTIQNAPKIKLLCEYWPWGIRATGVAPESFLEELAALGFVFYTIDETRRRLELVANIKSLDKKSSTDEYTSKTLLRSQHNFLCVKE